MKIVIVLLAIVGLVAGGSSNASTTKHSVKVADKDFVAKQKFLLEILYRIDEPLIFEEWIKLGKAFTFDKKNYNYDGKYMNVLYNAYKHGTLLPRGEFYGTFLGHQAAQSYGLFCFFYHANDWEVFQSTVAWARMNCNEGVFVYGLIMALSHRTDLNGLTLPSIYEILPQFYFNSKFIYEAEKFDYDVWNKYIMYEKEYKDILYEDNADFFNNHGNQNYFYTKDWKMWQWWKLMGLGEHWYSEDRFMLHNNMEKYNDSKYVDFFEGTKMFFMPVDYTRDIHFFNKESALSYFTEDIGWNAYWYYLNIDYSYNVLGDVWNLQNDKRGANWLYTIRQVLSRYYLERLSHGYGEIPEFSYLNTIEDGYNPQLVYHNGVLFPYRKNHYEVKDYGKFESEPKVMNFFKRLDVIISKGVFVTHDNKTIDLRDPKSIEFIGSALQGNMDVYEELLFRNWGVFAHMNLAGLDSPAYKVNPSIWLNDETLLRDPFFYIFYKKFSNVYDKFFNHIKPYTREQLLFPGVSIKDVKVSELVTFFDLVDFDVTTLLNDKPTFVDGQLVWNKTLLARQMRLNHKPFDFEYTIESDKPQKVVIRTFLGPKYDEFGRVISLTKNRENFFEIDSFIHTLNSGVNVFKRSSNDFYWTGKDRITYTELYKHVMLAHEGKYELPLDINEPHCRFPDRLLLPRGWYEGMPTQFFYYVSPSTASYEHMSSFNYKYSCGIGSGVRFVDDLPFGYPFDREIDEFEFFVPNMYFKDTKIYHKDTFEKYLEQKYQHFGHFDYNYLNH